MREGHTVEHHGIHVTMDALNLAAVATLSFSGMLEVLWQRLPGPTALYMAISAVFMLFQMSDKLGLLDRLKRSKGEIDDVPEQPKEHHK